MLFPEYGELIGFVLNLYSKFYMKWKIDKLLVWQACKHNNNKAVKLVLTIFIWIKLKKKISNFGRLQLVPASAQCCPGALARFFHTSLPENPNHVVLHLWLWPVALTHTIRLLHDKFIKNMNQWLHMRLVH